MSDKQLRQIQERIDKIKEELMTIGRMRPGSLTRQYRDPENRLRPFWQLSYTRNMKSRSEYIRPECVESIRNEVASYARFKRLTQMWVELSIEHSQLSMKASKTQAPK